MSENQGNDNCYCGGIIVKERMATRPNFDLIKCDQCGQVYMVIEREEDGKREGRKELQEA